MDYGNVAGNQYSTCLFVVTRQCILKVSELVNDPIFNPLVQLGLGKFGLAGVGIADIIFGIERQSAVLRKGAGGCEKQQKKKEISQSKQVWLSGKYSGKHFCRTGM